MNSVLSYIAGVIVIALFAALIGPSFVDWTQFRTQFETQASALTGLDVRIGGDIGFSILPAPRLELEKVIIGNRAQTEGGDLLSLEEARAEVALAPLLRGDLSVTSIRLIRPHLTIDIKEDGSTNWAAFMASISDDTPSRLQRYFGPDSISLENARFEDGTIAVRDRRIGASWQFTRLSGDLTAGSLFGPMRMAADFTVDERRGHVKLALGDFSGKKAFPVSAELSYGAPATHLSFSGIATEFSGEGRFDGALTVQAGRIDGENGKDGDDSLPVLDARAGVVISRRGASARSLEVVAGAAHFRGDAEADWSNAPTVSLALSAPAATLDELTGAGTALAPIFGVMMPPGSSSLGGQVDLTVAQLAAGQVAFTDVSAVLDMAADGGRTVAASGHLPGSTIASFSGAVLREPASGLRGMAANDLVLKGEATVDIGNLRAFGAWTADLYPVDASPAHGPARVEGAAIQQFTARAVLTAAHGRFELDGLTAGYGMPSGPKPIQGTVSYLWPAEASGRPSVDVALSVGAFDLAPLRAYLPLGPMSDAIDWRGMDARLALAARRLDMGDVTAKGLDAAVEMDEGGVVVDRFAVADLAGAQIMLTGGENGVARARLHDGIKGQMKARSLDGLVAAAARAGWVTQGAPGPLGPAALDFLVRSAPADEGGGRVETVDANGTIGGTAVQGHWQRRRISDGAGDLSLTLAASHPAGIDLFRQLGFSAKDPSGAPGSLNVQLSGPANGPLSGKLEAILGDGSIGFEGQVRGSLAAPDFEGALAISASSAALWSGVRLAGFGDGAARWAVAQLDGGPLTGTAAVVRDASGVVLSDIDLSGGQAYFKGSLANRKAGDGAKTALTGDLKIGRLSFDALFDVPTASVSGGAAAHERSGLPVDALDWHGLDAVDGKITVRSDAVWLGGLELDEAVSTVTIKDGVLTAPITGEFADGSMSVEVRLRGDEMPALQLALGVQDADLEKVSAMMFNTPFATGALDVTLQMEGRGRSLLGLISSLSGRGAVQADGGVIKGFDLALYSNGLDKIEKIEELVALDAQAFAGGATAYTKAVGVLDVKDGVVRLAAPEFVVPGARTQLDAFLDLPRQSLDTKLSVALDKPKNAPSFQITVTGEIDQPKRRYNTLALQEFVGSRLLAASVESSGLDVIPDELRDLLGLERRVPEMPPRAAPVPLPRPQRSF